MKLNTKASVALKFFIFISVVIGIIATLTENSFMKSASFLYFTVQSNIWIGVWCLIMAILQICELKSGRKLIRPWIRAVKYMFTTSITLTFFVMNVMLTPVLIRENGGETLLNLSNIFPHYVVPIASIADFVLFDTDWKPKRWTFLLSAIMPLYYLIFAFTLGYFGVSFTEDGQCFPYFFMDADALGWFSLFNPNGKYGAMTLGVVWWILILLIFILVMGKVYLLIQKKRYTSK